MNIADDVQVPLAVKAKSIMKLVGFANFTKDVKERPGQKRVTATGRGGRAGGALITTCFVPGLATQGHIHARRTSSHDFRTAVYAQEMLRRHHADLGFYLYPPALWMRLQLEV